MSKTNRSGQSCCLTQKQLGQFCSNLPEKYSLLSEMMYFSAGRVREVTTIKVKNLNFKTQLLTLEKSSTKTRETRTVPIREETLDKVKSWISDHDLTDESYIFFTSSPNTKFKRGEKPVTTQSVDEQFRKTFDWIGVKGCSTHSFRRSRLTHLMEKGWNMRRIMDISGHKNLSSLQKYLDSDRNETLEEYKKLMNNEVLG